MNAITLEKLVLKRLVLKRRWLGLIAGLVLIAFAQITISGQQAEPLPLSLESRVPTELLTNPGFEADTDGDGLPDGWSGKGIQLAKADQRKCNKATKVVAYSGECAFRFKGNPGGEQSKLMQQIADVSAIVDHSRLTLSAFVSVKGSSASPIATAKVQFSNHTKLKLELQPSGEAAYTPLTDSAVVVLPQGVSITKVKVSLSYGETSGSVWVDDVSLNVDASDSSDDIWQPAPGTTWQWQLTEDINTSFDVEMYDIDLFDTPQAVIDELQADGRIVICYFSAGSFEDWRPDAGDFPAEVLGDPLEGWPGERWLDIRRLDLLQPIMGARLAMAAEKDCDGVEPDNVDGYTNDTGFALSDGDQLAYNRWLANAAHELGLSIGLKNDLDQIPQLVEDFDWALNEQCFQYEECDRLLPFIEAGKAVFGVEYNEEGLSRDDYCPAANELGFSWLTKTYDLSDIPPNSCLDYPPRSNARR